MFFFLSNVLDTFIPSLTPHPGRAELGWVLIIIWQANHVKLNITSQPCLFISENCQPWIIYLYLGLCLTFSDFSFPIKMLMLTDFWLTNRFECRRMELNFVFHVKLGDWPWLYLGGSLIVLTWFSWVCVGSRGEWKWSSSLSYISISYAQLQTASKILK